MDSLRSVLQERQQRPIANRTRALDVASGMHVTLAAVTEDGAMPREDADGYLL